MSQNILIFFFLLFVSSNVLAQNNASEPPLVPFSDGLRFGFKDSLTQKIRIVPEYNGVSIFYGRYAKVKVNNKWGVINKKGDRIVDMVYDSVMILKNNFFLCYSNYKISILDDKKVTVGSWDSFLKVEEGSGISAKFIDPTITDIIFKTRTIYVVNSGGLFLNVTRTDTTRVEHGDGMITKYFTERNMYPYIKGGRFFMLNENMELITESEIAAIFMYVKISKNYTKKSTESESKLVDISDMKSVEQYGLRNIDLSKPIYIKTKGKWEVIDVAGKLLFPTKFDEIKIENGNVTGLAGSRFFNVSKEGKLTQITE